MRRGRWFALAAVSAVMLLSAATAYAATPQSLFTHNAITQGYGGVGTPTQPAQGQGPANVAGAHKTVKTSATPSGVAPATHTAGSLPFTGQQLTVFVLLGLALIAGGMLFRRVGRHRAVA